MSGGLERKVGLGEGVALSKTGLQLRKDLSFERWVEIGEQLGQLVLASQWAIGDWVFHGQWEYRKRYEEALAITGLDYGTLRNFAYVAGRFPHPRRHANLSFSHHKIVAGLKPAEADRWLARAEVEGWSNDALLQHMRQERELGAGDEHQVLEQIRLTAPADRVVRWQAAAERAESSIVDWAVAVLDIAAAEVE